MSSLFRRVVDFVSRSPRPSEAPKPCSSPSSAPVVSRCFSVVSPGPSSAPCVVDTSRPESASVEDTRMISQPESVPVVEDTRTMPRPQSIPVVEETRTMPRPQSIPVVEGTQTISRPQSIPVVEGTQMMPRPQSIPVVEGTQTISRPQSIPVVEGTRTISRPQSIPVVEGTQTISRPQSIPVVEGTRTTPRPQSVSVVEGTRTMPRPQSVSVVADTRTLPQHARATVETRAISSRTEIVFGETPKALQRRDSLMASTPQSAPAVSSTSPCYIRSNAGRYSEGYAPIRVSPMTSSRYRSSRVASIYCAASPSKHAPSSRHTPSDPLTLDLSEASRDSPRNRPQSPATTVCVDSPRSAAHSPVPTASPCQEPAHVEPTRPPDIADASPASICEISSTRRSSDSSVELVSMSQRPAQRLDAKLSDAFCIANSEAIRTCELPVVAEDDAMSCELPAVSEAVADDDAMSCELPEESEAVVEDVAMSLPQARNEADDPMIDRPTQPRPDGLYPHQVVGVEWMASIYRKRSGCILADDMGLGKTVQVCSMLSSVRARSVLMIMPVSLIGNWQRELAIWCPSLRVTVLHGSKTRQAKALNMGSSGVLITSYETLGKCAKDVVFFTVTSGPKKKKMKVDDDEGDPMVDPFADEPWEIGHQSPWDVVVFDESQRLKNPSTLVGKAAHMVQARTRIALSGTPIQNNLLDLWSVMDVCVPGLLGNMSRFRLSFVEPIDRGSLRSSTSYEVDLKNVLAGQLHELIQPYLLRRTKDEVNLLKDVKKTELVLWVRPSRIQADIYRRVLKQSADIQSIADSHTTKLGLEVFRAVNMLKKICNTPLLAHPNASDWNKLVGFCCENTLEDSLPAELLDGDELPPSQEANDMIREMISGFPTDRDSLIAQSAKLQVLVDLIPQLIRKGHRVVIFSASTKMCDLITVTVLKPLNINFLRIDGSYDQQERECKINAFQDSSNYSVFLSSTQVGGVGLTLHGADRVILVDPAWNPATDAQAVDRVFRIGQVRDVVAYRFICSGMIEEKMFRLQVYKMSISNAALGSSTKATRYFSKNDIKALFEMENPDVLATKKRMEEKHGEEDIAARVFREDMGDTRKKRWCLGCSDFSKLFSSLDDEVEEPGVEREDIRELLDELSRKSAEATQQRELKQRQADDAQVQMDNSEAQQREIVKERKEALENVERLKTENKAAKKLYTQQQQLLENRERDLPKAYKALAQAEKVVETRQQALDALEIKVDDAQVAASTCKNDFLRCADEIPTFDSVEGRELVQSFRAACEDAELQQAKLNEQPECALVVSAAAQATKHLESTITQLVAFKRITGLKQSFQVMYKVQAKTNQLEMKLRDVKAAHTAEEAAVSRLMAEHDECFKFRDAAKASANMAKSNSQSVEEELRNMESLLERLKDREKVEKARAEDLRRAYAERRKDVMLYKKQEQDAVRERKGKEDELDSLKRKHAEIENAKKSNLEELKAESYEADQVERLFKRRKKDKRSLQEKVDTP